MLCQLLTPFQNFLYFTSFWLKLFNFNYDIISTGVRQFVGRLVLIRRYKFFARMPVALWLCNMKIIFQKYVIFLRAFGFLIDLRTVIMCF